MARAFATIAFTPEVRAQQTRMGSAEGHGNCPTDDVTDADELGPEEAHVIGARDGFYQASVSQSGWPYVQFRGGPDGFLEVLTSRTLAYADLRGHRQDISAGNLSGNDRLSRILVDHPKRRRPKLWGRVRLSESTDTPETLGQSHNLDCPARP